MELKSSERSADGDAAADPMEISGSRAADEDSESSVADASEESARSSEESSSPPRYATVFAVVVVLVLTALGGWLGFRAFQAQQASDRRDQFLQTAEQGARNLTTIDWQQADADVRRILDGATEHFYDDFDQRSRPFIEAVQESKAKTIGTVADAGLESETNDSARALVAVTVQTSNAGVTEPVQRSWRLRLDLKKVADQIKVSNVEFVL